MPIAERTFSKFLQHPNDIMSDLARGPVLLRRRDQDNLVVMTGEQNEALTKALQTFTSVAVHGSSAAATSLPWLYFLPAKDQRECLAELASAVTAALSTGRLDLLRDTLYAWEATGVAAWDYRNRGGQPGYDEETPVDVERPA